MGDLPVLLFLLVLGPLVILLIGTRRAVWAWAKPLLTALMHRSGGLLKDTEVGLAQVQLLRGWRPASNTPGVMQAADPLRRRFLSVISESRSDFTDEMDIREYSRRTFSGWTGSGQILELHGPEERMVAGLKALQTEAVVAQNRTLIRYLHTAIEGQRAFHQVVAWSAPSAFDRAVFERLLDGFAELPGSDAVLRSTRFAQPRSGYDVH